jgi:hypothetical protein
MNIQKFRKPHFLKKEHCPTPRRFIITGAETMDVSRSAKEEKIRVTIDFQSENGDRFRNSLNDVNLKVIAQAYGNETDAWIGKPIVFRYDPTIEMDGEVVGGLRVSIPKPTLTRRTTPRPAQTPAPVSVGRKIDDDGQEIPF